MRICEGKSVGEVHTLVVRVVGDHEPHPVTAYEKCRNFEDYEIEHLPTCEVRYGMYACHVGFEERDLCIRWTLEFSGTPVTEPGTYRIQAWEETVLMPGFTEYAGIALCERTRCPQETPGDVRHRKLPAP